VVVGMSRCKYLGHKFKINLWLNVNFEVKKNSGTHFSRSSSCRWQSQRPKGHIVCETGVCVCVGVIRPASACSRCRLFHVLHIAINHLLQFRFIVKTMVTMLQCKLCLKHDWWSGPMQNCSDDMVGVNWSRYN
jgi:hypothetical protein